MAQTLAHIPPQPRNATHDVSNQPPPLTPYDSSEDAALLEGLRREGAGWAEEDVRRLGRAAGSEEAQEWGDQANRHEPSCARTTATATGSTRSSSTPAGTA